MDLFLNYLLYFFIYSLTGWVVEVFVIAVTRHRFANRGVLNLPLCVSYGVIMNLLIMLTGENTKHGFIMFMISFVVISAVQYMGGALGRRLTGRQLWDYMDMTAFGGRWKGMLVSLILSFSFFTFLKLVHPFVFMFVHILPGWLKWIICLVLLTLLVFDILALAGSEKKHDVSGPETGAVSRRGFRIDKQAIGRKIYNRIWKRLNQAYPYFDRTQTENAADADEAGEETKGPLFAQGLCFDKLFWIFMIFGIFGNIVETLLVRYQTGIWMRRASLLFVPISIVWGFGGVLFMIILSHMARKEDRYIFIGAFFLGGSFEYLCSVFTETFLGTRFWDYSKMPFNLDGRTNLLFMFLWGFTGMIWIKVLYPRVNGVIEQIPPVLGRAVTMIMALMVAFDLILSASVILRSVTRRERPEAANVIEAYLDENYPDEIVKRHWRNIRFGN